MTNAGHSILIAAITPYFLERGVLWFTEHAEDIRKKAAHDPWWREHTVFLEAGSHMPFSPFLRKLSDMGYAKTSTAEQPGEFSVHGGIVDVFPTNLERPIRIEFAGNNIEGISPLPLQKPAAAPKIALPKDASEYERLWLAGLRAGDYLVHIDHGIGIFRGFISHPERSEGSPRILRSAQNDAVEQFYMVEYAPSRRGGVHDRLYVPRSQAPKLSRYVGFETPTIHRLGGTVWETTKRRAKEDARKFAEELIELFKSRARATRQPYPLHGDIERHLAHSFAYEETPDQEKALEEIRADLSRDRPMDRLLLGDVGFGKTEVAIRVAARVAYSGQQVALLAPTTILADQHSQTFRERLKDLPFEIGMLTRLTSKRSQKREIEKLRTGETDIIIGTHRLLSSDVVFRDLGLVIIDEEQRFGVRHKEKFKQLRAGVDPVRGKTPSASAAPTARASNGVDILSLSATPIPRTMSLALSKFREISLIQTPPPGRLPIQTFVLPFSTSLAREAIAAELKRKGQIFYLWNRIENIESIRRDIERLAPKAKTAVLHGRMRERELIRVMHAFRSGDIDILLATTIIENGLDLPSVNTLIVANAARLGLSQAYQIRGRIGRGDKSAYAYFLYPTHGLTEKGKLRLQALKEAEGMGAGFQIALKDLEIRGAGNILGRQQSGTMNKVGLNLYAQLLNEALEELE